MSFELLSEPIRKYIRDKRWEQLRPIQHAAITKILTTQENYILASRTASGKTEAAFLPILSKVDFNETGVQVLYISPLVALINDQFYRIEELCKSLEISVVKWHGEANKTAKNNLIKQPSGIVLITPESLEAMFVNKPFNVKQLFSNLKFVIVDEIHSFIGTDRGTQLKSILSRLQNKNANPFTIIGLSATIGDYEEAKKFTGSPANTKVLLDRTSKDVNATFRYFKSQNDELPFELIKDLYLTTKDHKALIFPNSRGRAEEIAVKLKKISDKVKGHKNYFSHHSSVDKELREYVENFAKNSTRQNFSIACTSTLELGIDIGTVDEVVQIDATYSIASLIQRVGRSGRKDGQTSNLFLYATDEWNLLQSLACWLLYQEGFIEPPSVSQKSYDILLHQALSIAKSHSGIELSVLAKELQENFAFNEINIQEINEILAHLIEIGFLEKIRKEVVIGIDGERLVNGRDFYSVFKSEEKFKVVHSGNTIGEVPFSPQISEDENILLAAKVWKITLIDFKTHKIEVIPAKDGKKPVFFGTGSIIHEMVREKMLEILVDSAYYEVLDDAGQNEINEMRTYFKGFPLENLYINRPVLRQGTDLQFFTFTSTKINRTLQLLFNIFGIENSLDEKCSIFDLETSKNRFLQEWKLLCEPLDNIDKHILQALQETPTLLDFSKWGRFLPQKFQVTLIKHQYYDLEGTKKFIQNITPTLLYTP